MDRERKGDLPTYIVRAIGATSSRDWPTGELKFEKNYNEHLGRLLFEAFIQKHGYSVVWSNEYFEILRV